MDNNSMEPVRVKEKGNGGLIAIMSILLVLIIAVGVAITGFYLEWFSISKNKIELSNNSTNVEEDGSVTINVNNFGDLERPAFSFSGYDEKLIDVKTGRNGSIVITGLSEGTTSITVSAKDCRNEIINVTVDHARPVTKLTLQGMAYSTGNQEYYFVNDSEYAVISDNYEDYVRGGYTVEKMDMSGFADIYSVHYNDLQKEMDGLVNEGTFYYVTLDGEDEFFGGSHYSGNADFLIISVNRKKLAIYDSSWDELTLAEEIDMLETDEIDEYFIFETPASGSSAGASSSGTSSSGTPASSSNSSTVVQNTIAYNSFGGFGSREAIKETWKLAAYGDSFVYKSAGGNLCLVSASDFNADKPGTKLDTAGDEVSFFAVDGDLIVYVTDSNQVGIYDLKSGDSSVICDSIEVSDMTIMGGTIYLTDYEYIWAMDKDGTYSEIWDYGAWSMDIDGNFMYIYDSYAWDIYDLDSGEYIGEFVSDLNADYECDVIEHAGDYIFTVVYEYDSEKIYVRAINVNTGDNYNISAGAYGAKMDSYSVAFINKYIYYTTNNGEIINRIDVTTGENISQSYSSTDIYYSSELMEINGVLYGGGRDKDDEACVFVINQSSLEIEDIYYLK